MTTKRKRRGESTYAFMRRLLTEQPRHPAPGGPVTTDVLRALVRMANKSAELGHTESQGHRELRTRSAIGGEATRAKFGVPTDEALENWILDHDAPGRTNSALAHSAAGHFKCGVHRLRGRIGKLRKHKK